MNPAPLVTPHDVSPEAAIGRIQSHAGPILLDLDETLYLRNSTEDFIDCARPQASALLLLKLLGVLRPWRWTGGAVTRDVWRVNLVRTCFPGTIRLWHERLPILASRFANLRLLAAISRTDQEIVVATAGFQHIVVPLVAALGLPDARIVAARWSTFADRRTGKRALVTEALGPVAVSTALVLTDSADDLPLLAACALPLRTIWPEAHYREGLSGAYLPGQYLSRIKRPGEHYISRGILQEDFAFWVLSSIGLAAAPATHLLGLLFLLASFWTVYELGYVDNDAVAKRFEKDPKLSAAFADGQVPTPRWQPWIWSAALGLAAIALLRWPQRPAWNDAVRWGAVLLATHGWFYYYNRFDKLTRIWLYAGLQLARVAALVMLVPVTAIGALALGSHVLAKWVPYCAYRIGGAAWPTVPVHLVRLMFFMIMAAALACATGFPALLNGGAAALLAWNVYRARKELAEVWHVARRLDRPARAGQ
jgi:hypothetical protein